MLSYNMEPLFIILKFLSAPWLFEELYKKIFTSNVIRVQVQWGLCSQQILYIAMEELV